MSLESGLLPSPVIKPAAANRLLEDVGLDPKGQDIDSSSARHLSLWDSTKRVAREQAQMVKSMNPDLLGKIAKVSAQIYPNRENYQRTFNIASMSVIRVYGYQLGEQFAQYLRELRDKRLDDFGVYLGGSTPFSVDDTILDEVLNGPEIPEEEPDLKRAVQYISHYCIDSDYADKFRVGAGATRLAIENTWVVSPSTKTDLLRPDLELKEMQRVATILNPKERAPYKVI